MSELLSVERRDAVALVTLNRPEKRNALSIELRVELAEAFAALSVDDGVGCIVLTGAGSAFCAGMDTDQFGGDLDHRRLVATSAAAFGAVRDCRRPIVAAVNGPALAGGFALCLLCDLRIAATAAASATRSCRGGFRRATPQPAPCSLPRSPRISASPAASSRRRKRSSLGIIREVTGGDVVARAIELAERIASLPRDAILETKRRTLLERKRLWGFLFDEEERVFEQALLGTESGG